MVETPKKWLNTSSGLSYLQIFTCDTLLKTNEYPLKIDAWKMIHFLLKWSLFRGRIPSFSLRKTA